MAKDSAASNPALNRLTSDWKRLVLRWDLTVEGKEFQSLMPRKIVELPSSDVEGTGLGVTKNHSRDEGPKRRYGLR
jgi:hypothetical protein